MRITYESYVIGGVMTKIKIVRSSWLCRLLFHKYAISIGETIYVRSPILEQKVLRRELFKMAARKVQVAKGVKFVWWRV
jgi:hypothetical protein